MDGVRPLSERRDEVQLRPSKSPKPADSGARIRIGAWGCILARAGFTAEARRRNEVLPLEGAIERGLGLISNLSRDLGNTAAACFQYLCSELQPPPRQIRYGWFAQIMPESLGQNGT